MERWFVRKAICIGHVASPTRHMAGAVEANQNYRFDLCGGEYDYETLREW